MKKREEVKEKSRRGKGDKDVLSRHLGLQRGSVKVGGRIYYSCEVLLKDKKVWCYRFVL